MPRYLVEWTVKVPAWAYVDASDEKEAVRKARIGDVVEGSQDSDPGKRDLRTFRVMRRVKETDR